jgi:tRNA nucleotidyltransferase (CCA-adding enzyme)
VKLILTHENADFDAVAAQLAAHKLDPSALPVLPRRLNYNVRDFVNLYRSALPHVKVSDLPRQMVEAVTVVDTQSVLTVKGMRPQTPAHIIDHHPLTAELPAHQTFWGDQVGATTTLLVEQLRESSISLTAIEATLMLLGIYEDTGSLLYGTTTPRDMLAAAWLASNGADLDVVRRFLQHPLNDEQRALYDVLLKNAVVRDVHGHAVAIAAARVPDNIDQVSTVAHKLREILEPGALFMLVQMGSRLQLVARSGVDEIDVGVIADRLGGGGHRRAAAALIEDADLDDIRRRLDDLLTELVEPTVTVSDLMSLGVVRTVPAHTPIRDVAEEMRRSGHEGYPVVQDGDLVGLLTRHAVDRAISHKMGNRPVSQIMESGRVVVSPSDSIHYLQQQMMRTGWGQIPVVNDRNELIGIVTRTDLISQWGMAGNGSSRRKEIVSRLERALSSSLLGLVTAVSEQAQSMGLGLYCVGGFVRDLLLERPNTDIDLVVEGDAIALVRELVARYGGRMRKHAQFGTATWILDEQVSAAFTRATDWPETVDFVTARDEFYTWPTALPTVSEGSIKLDLHRRDFSINTLAIRLAPEPFGQLLDFWGGERDLQAGRIRVLHSLSFVDDPTRILRAARFEQRFDFDIEQRTLGLIEGALPLLDRVSGPRIRHELELILLEARPELALRRLESLGALAYLSEDLTADDWLFAAFEAARQARSLAPWTALESEINRNERWMLVLFVTLCCRLATAEAERLGRRLQVKRQTLDEVLNGTRTFQERLPVLKEIQQPSGVVEALEGVSDLGLIVAWVIAPTHTAREQIVRYVTEWRDVRYTITREALVSLGLQPGPLYGEVLRRLRNAWLDGEIDSPEAERELAAALVADGNNRHGKQD